jgi:hypothetical protein
MIKVEKKKTLAENPFKMRERRRKKDIGETLGDVQCEKKKWFTHKDTMMQSSAQPGVNNK